MVISTVDSVYSAQKPYDILTHWHPWEFCCFSVTQRHHAVKYIERATARSNLIRGLFVCFLYNNELTFELAARQIRFEGLALDRLETRLMC